jgi:RNA polymerase sigma-70 factor (ECF subfamily)
MINKIYIEYLLLKNDKASFQQVLSIISPKLLAFANSILKDNSLSQDAVQESMLAIIKGFSKLKDHRKFHVWIYQVTRNKCLDLIRKNQKYKNDSDIDSISEPKAQDNDLDTQLDVMKMINQLSLHHKNVIHLFYYDGFSILEMSEILKKPAGTIKSLLFDAREQLKQLIGE